MTEQEKTAIKQAYQTAAEMTYIVALGLSKAAKKQKLEKFYAKEKKRVMK
ncbi:MAG: hypothetical protein SAK29_12190 [Scytonema sp. PMC 1069.18]|nr:hypothetical protein [Scytonema sp. PMC 1069.18]MEC4886675.1 hypothetical protein [Scytonema sp. PMC 1070.18]